MLIGGFSPKPALFSSDPAFNLRSSYEFMSKKAAPFKDGAAFQIACISDLRYRMFSLQDIELCEPIDLRCEEVGCISLRGLYVMVHLF